MTFTKIVTVKAALLQAQSSKILSTFSKTKDDLLKMNETLAKGVQENESQILSLKQENDQLNALAAQLANIISDISLFLGV